MERETYDFRAPWATLAFCAALLVASSSRAATTTVSDTVNLTGNVTNLCVLGTPTPSSVDLGTIANTSGPDAGKLASIPTQQVELPDSFCNYAGTQMTVDASALLAADNSTPPSGYSRAVNFTATVDVWASTAASVGTQANADGTNADANAAGGVLDSAKNTDLTLSLTNFTSPGNGYLVAGSYAGSVTITVGPALD